MVGKPFTLSRPRAPPPFEPTRPPPPCFLPPLSHSLTRPLDVGLHVRHVLLVQVDLAGRARG